MIRGMLELSRLLFGLSLRLVVIDNHWGMGVGSGIISHFSFSSVDGVPDAVLDACAFARCSCSGHISSTTPPAHTGSRSSEKDAPQNDTQAVEEQSAWSHPPWVGTRSQPRNAASSGTESSSATHPTHHSIY
jgi:hypothetical protein